MRRFARSAHPPGISHLGITVRLTSSALLVAGLLSLALLPALAQRGDPPLTTLARPDRVLPAEFTQVAGFLELRDGRALVSDRGEERLVVVDFTAGNTTPIGGKGSGPGEYRLPGRLIPWTGDSILLNDGGNNRLAIIGPDLRIARSFTLGLPGVPTTLAPRAVDQRGRMYLQIPRWASESYGRRGDSVPVVRVDPREGAARGQVLTWVVQAADPGPRKFGLPYIPFTPEDGWSVTREGRLVLVRSNDYHVEWWDESGRPAITGAPVRTPSLPVTRPDKVAYVRRFLEAATIGGRGGPGSAPSGESNLPADMRSEAEVTRMVEQNKFGTMKAPITDAAPILAPDGRLWVERSVPFGAASEWDVFDHTGSRIRSVRLPAGRRLLAVGRAAVYLLAVDEDGFQRVERYRM